MGKKNRGGVAAHWCRDERGVGPGSDERWLGSRIQIRFRAVRVEAVAAQDTALLTRLVRDLVAGLRTSDVETVTYGAATHAELRAAQAATALLIGPSSTRTVTGPDDLEPHVLHFDL